MIPDFNQYLSRHGEDGIQAIIERLERYEGVKADIAASLEERWNLLMNGVQPVACISQALAA